MNISSVGSKLEELLFSSKQRLVSVLFIAIMILSLPVTLLLLNQPQDIRQHADTIAPNPPCNPSGPSAGLGNFTDSFKYSYCSGTTYIEVYSCKDGSEDGTDTPNSPTCTKSTATTAPPTATPIHAPAQTQPQPAQQPAQPNQPAATTAPTPTPLPNIAQVPQPTATPVPQPTATPVPTTQPLATATPTTQPAATATPAPTSAGAGDVAVGLNVLLPGIGTNTAIGNNANPLHKNRTFTIQLTDGNGTVVKETQVSLTFTAGSYTGTATIPGVPSGAYLIKVRSDNSLYKALPVKQLTSTATATPQITLVTGNINNTGASLNLLDVLDYNSLLSCYGGAACDATLKPLTDLNDDGVVDSKDLNILFRGFAIRQGD